MKLEHLVGDRFKERPADCQVDSHALMVRGGYIKYVANGIYSSSPPLKRVLKKLEQIMREEMDALDGQEVQFPVVMPASLWAESGRYESIGKELLRFTDRNGADMVLGMTHEEAAVQLVREYAGTYTKYPFMIYQIQTKFRDEARPRAGLIRVREFTMKDAYSFHTSQEDLDDYYEKCHKAYERIFARAGVPEVISVASDSGMMGGSVSHEFMLLTPIGEDSIVLCDDCGYKANMEAAESILEPVENAPSQPLTKVHTPGMHTIEEVCTYLHLEGRNNLCAGANETDYHYTGVDMQRDVPGAEYHDFAKVVEGGICPCCGKKSIHISRGIEVGNNVQLGKKYTEPMGMTYTDRDGKSRVPIMGCYGIGVGRLAAAVCEAHHDDYGPIWPKAIAPWQVHLCAVRADNEEVRAFADTLYNTLQEKGVEVIYDDRSVSAGVMFSDADLLGVPLRVIVSPRNLKNGVVELTARDKSFSETAPTAEAVDAILAKLAE